MDQRDEKHPFTTSGSGQSPDCQQSSLFMDRSWTIHGQQEQLGPDGQDHPWIVQGQKIALHCQELSGTEQ